MRTGTTIEHWFWDASALVLVSVDQRGSHGARQLHQKNPRTVVWWGSQIETASAIARLVRDGLLDGTAADRSKRRLDALRRASIQIEPSDDVLSHARALVDAHPLRAADALQLAAALVAVNEKPRGRVFVCADARLAQIARAVGFDVRP